MFAYRPVFAAPPSVVCFLPELWQFLCSLSAGCSAPPEGKYQDQDNKYTLLSFMKMMIQLWLNTGMLSTKYI